MLVDFHPEALNEAQEAGERYEAERTGLGGAFRLELSKIGERIGDNPYTFAVEEDSIRFAPFKRFPYSLVYEILDDRIWVLAVAHHSRRQGYWANRRQA